ncbi:TIGR00341 family protein [Halobacteriales archaeon QS_1_67_19]|nr:MAG: TIGR00341 family protein [Halobacteriales archaeon QS_1_67_19]
MRLLHVLVSESEQDPVYEALEEKDVDFTVLQTTDRNEGDVLVQAPLPSDGVGDVLRAIDEAGLDEERYTVIGAAESASTPRMERLEKRYADDFDPLTRRELRSKARNMAHDRASFVWMIFLSAVIATAGLLANSPAVVVGSMVIAPIVGPVLTAGVAATTGDREMLVDSVRLQLLGLAVAVVGAAAFAALLKSLVFVPPHLDISTIDLISVRIAPTFSSLVVGIAAGAAAAFGLVTKGPTSLIGVMIAAALIPAAATVGIALVWGYQVVAVGTAMLLLVTIVAINLAVLATLWGLRYRSVDFERGLVSVGSATRTAKLAVAAVVLLAAIGLVAAGSYQQIAFERTVNEQVRDVVSAPEYAALDVVTVRSEYAAEGGLLEPATVTVTLSRTADESHPELADAIRERLAAATRYSPAVRVRFVDYQEASSDASVSLRSPLANAAAVAPEPPTGHSSSKGSSGS